jgi:hypothetical protein
MRRWLWSTLGEVGWYVVLVSGWLCWLRAHQHVRQQARELRVMAQSWRSATRHKETP